jgi:hypothetical protein
MAEHEIAGAQPGGRLLADFAERVEVAQPVLLLFAPAQQFCGYWLPLRQTAQPLPPGKGCR